MGELYVLVEKLGNGDLFTSIHKTMEGAINTIIYECSEYGDEVSESDISRGSKSDYATFVNLETGSEFYIEKSKVYE